MSYAIEQAALSSLLMGGWHHGGHALVAEDFTEARHRAVFLKIKSLIDAGRDVDVYAVADRLNFDIDDIANLYASARSIVGYVEQLQDERLQREVSKAAQAILSGTGSGKEQLIAAQSLLASLQGQVGGEAKRVGELLSDWLDELTERVEGGEFLKTGFPDVDHRLGGLRGGDLIIVAGRPAMGKTALALNIAEQCNQPTAFFSLEMSNSSLIDRMAASLARVHLGKIRSPKDMTDAEWSAITKATERINAMPLHVDDTAGITIEDIHARARTIKAKHGLSLVIVDYLQLIAADPRMVREQQVAHISRTTKRMAKDLDVPVIMLAQLSRKCEERGDKRPIMSDLRESGAIEQDADAVAMVYRDEVYNPQSPLTGFAELLFRKVRQGATGTDWFHFEGVYQSFRQAVQQDIPKATVLKGPYA